MCYLGDEVTHIRATDLLDDHNTKSMSDAKLDGRSVALFSLQITIMSKGSRGLVKEEVAGKDLLYDLQAVSRRSPAVQQRRRRG